MRRMIAAWCLLGLCAIGLAGCDYDDDRRGYYGPPSPVIVQTPAPATASPTYVPPPTYYAPPAYYPLPGYYGRGGGEDD